MCTMLKWLPFRLRSRFSKRQFEFQLKLQWSATPDESPALWGAGRLGRLSGDALNQTEMASKPGTIYIYIIHIYNYTHTHDLHLFECVCVCMPFLSFVSPSESRRNVGESQHSNPSSWSWERDCGCCACFGRHCSKLLQVLGYSFEGADTAFQSYQTEVWESTAWGASEDLHGSMAKSVLARKTSHVKW